MHAQLVDRSIMRGCEQKYEPWKIMLVNEPWKRYEVVLVTPNRILELKTTRSWDFLGLSLDGSTAAASQDGDLLSRSNMGDGIIVRILDSGIWPEAKSLKDEGFGPIPSAWRGFCESGQQFDPAKHCNRKLIGARSFRYNNHTVDQEEFLSPRDLTGHGTHVSFSSKVVMCYTVNGLSPTELQKAMELVGKNGGVALIIAKESTDFTLVKFSLEFNTIPFIEINYELGNRIEKYIQTSLSSPLVSIGTTRTLTGKPITPKVAFSSSRGPSSITPSILKPDIAAPGEFIVAQTSPPPLLEEEVADKQGYRMLTGTSMAAPHVAGVIALLKATHSDWSPAAMSISNTKVYISI